MAETRKLAAILVSDVVGYSRLAGRDEELTLARLRALRSDLIDPIIAVHHGRVVKRTGDGAIVEFRSVVDAVRCAIETQNGIIERNIGVPPERRIEFRIGIHLGDVMEESDGDLMGDGVNIAARLQSICEPNGICLSEDAYRQVKSRLDLAVTDLGDKELKNIVDPVRVYSLTVGVPAQAKPATPATVPKQSRGKLLIPVVSGLTALLVIAAVLVWYFLIRPGANLATNAPAHLSIVVLPFANLSNDPKQDYFADGITENLTTDLSRIRNSFVIARNTAFTYRGKSVDAKEIGKDLGVRYVLEGSVQRDGNRVRVNAQLIDAESGSHLWAERFEEDLADLFKLQDDVVARLANALGYELINAEAARAARAINPDAIDLTMQGWTLMRKQSTKANNDSARALFGRALSIDPTDSDALAGVAETYGRSYDYGWDDSPVDYDAKVIGLADRAIALNPTNALAYYPKAVYLSQTKRPAEALATAEAGLEHAPNIATLHFARAISEMSLGRYEESQSDLLQAIRLSPRDPQLNLYHTLLAGAELLLGDDEATILYARKATEEGYRGWYAYAYLAASYAFLGRDAEARAALADARRVNPALTIKWAMAHSADGPRFFEGLRKAGLPEDEQPKHLSIVVLPFTNLSNDPKQEYFADGITDNLTTDLSRIRNSFVIARNTAFTYKGKAVDAKEIGKDLGVRYVLEGSVARDGNRVRVNVQLIDAESGTHLWADRFEEDLADLFKLQDDVVARLSRTLQVELVDAEAQRGLRDRPQNPDSIDLTMQGWAWVNRTATAENFGAARAAFKKALMLDDANVDALVGFAFVSGRGYAYAWPGWSADAYEQGRQAIDRAITLDPSAANAYFVKSNLLMWKMAGTADANEVLDAAATALRLNPGLAGAYYTMSGAEEALGKCADGKSHLQEAIKISPRDPDLGRWRMALSRVDFCLRQYDEAVQEARRALDTGFRTTVSYIILAAACQADGRSDDAKSAVADALKLMPGLSVAWFHNHIPSFLVDPPGFLEAVRKAGLPEDEGPRLSIVVLPFQNLSGDTKQDYLADVLADELTTYISRIPGSFVIARNTAFTYKGKPIDVREIGKDLGVRYALEGSVQPTDKRIRTNAQLIDTETGAHLWAEEFDADKTDLLETEDEIVTRLAHGLQIQMTDIETARLQRVQPANQNAEDLALQCQARGLEVGFLGPQAETAYRLCEQALAIDPNNVRALAISSEKFWLPVAMGHSLDPKGDLAKADAMVSRALAIDPNYARAHYAKSGVLLGRKRFDEMILEDQRVISLDPSSVEGYGAIGNAFWGQGHYERAVEYFDKAVRLSPNDPRIFYWYAGIAGCEFALGHNELSIDAARKTLASNPNFSPIYITLAAALALTGRQDEARDIVRQHNSMDTPLKSIVSIKNSFALGIQASYWRRLEDGLRKAGMPEQ